MRQFGKNQTSGMDLWRVAERQITSSSGEILHQARIEFVRVLLAKGEATTDDLRSKIPVPKSVDPRFFGGVPTVFVRRKIIAGGVYVHSRRSASHARVIQLWKLIDRQAAVDWMARNSAALQSQGVAEAVTPASALSGERVDSDL